MTRILLLVLLVAAAGWIPAAVSYARREPAVPGLLAPAILRGLAFLVVLFLLIDPRIPGADPVLDPRPPGSSEAGREAGRWVLEEDHALVPTPQAGPGPSGQLPEPGEPGARLRVPADSLPWVLLRLAEAGAREVTLVSPFRGDLEPLSEAVEALAALPSPPALTLEPVGVGIRNAGIVAFDVDPRPASSGRGGPGGVPELEGVVLVGGEGAPGDSARLTVHAGETELLDEWVPIPEPGARARIAVRIPVPAPADPADPADPAEPVVAEEPLRVVARVALPGDAYPADDERSRLVTPDAGTEGILFLAHGPDPEPRLLLPLLEQATGLDGDGWIRVGPDQFVALARPGDPFRSATTEALARAIPRARLLVLQGPPPAVSGALAPEASPAFPEAWAEAAAAHPARLFLLPGGPARVWTLDPSLPASPLAGFLPELGPGGSGATGGGGATGVSLASLPPLALAESPAGGGEVALRVRTPGQPPAEAVVFEESGEGAARTVEVRVSGLWRWAGRDGVGSALYRGIWGGAAAWVLAPGTRPVAGSPGARAEEDPPRALEPPGDLESLRERVDALGPRGEGGELRERTLRSHPLPWFLVIGLLAGEWVLRRRLGLR